jgi:hypothetical protein
MSPGVGRAPTKRTYEMFCFYLSEWASEKEVVAHIDRLHLKAIHLKRDTLWHQSLSAPA